MQTICLALQVFDLVRYSAPDIFWEEVAPFCFEWIAWPDLYQVLLEQGLIWDFRDLFTASVACFGTDIACRMFSGEEPPSKIVIHNWVPDDGDEGTYLAQLDMLVAMMMHASKPKWQREAAKSLVRDLAHGRPDSMGTRPVMEWMLAKAFESSFTDEGNGSIVDPFAYLSYYPGMVLKRNGRISLPIYVPFDFEVPGWSVPDAPKEARAAVEMTLSQATQLQDYSTQALCLKLLIMQTPHDPSELFAQLGDLQKSVGDKDGYLRTLLSSYLACRGKEAEMRLLAELKQLPSWTESNVLRDAHVHLAKQQMERVLTAKRDGRRTFPPLSRSSMTYYPWLSEDALQFLQMQYPSGKDAQDQASSPTRRERARSSTARLPETKHSNKVVLRAEKSRYGGDDLDARRPSKHRRDDDLEDTISLEIPRTLTLGKSVTFVVHDHDYDYERERERAQPIRTPRVGGRYTGDLKIEPENTATKNTNGNEAGAQQAQPLGDFKDLEGIRMPSGKAAEVESGEESGNDAADYGT